VFRTLSLLLPMLMTMAACEAKKPPPPPLTSGATAAVTRIVKGDELLVEKDAHQYRVRMLGIDAFRKFLPNEDFAKMHDKVTRDLEKALLTHKVKLIFGKTVKDVHGRYLAYVELDGVDINRKLVTEGYVLVYNKFSFSREDSYVEAEKKARKNKSNLWAVPRLVNVALTRRKTWAEDRKQREGSVPEYYLQLDELTAPEESTDEKPIPDAGQTD